ncbi:G-type lectin S-receptor-like serine/threonine-protein kinase LECRK2 [Phragmites australis]|uniref:G-type lectin S-receptor-like serine/threonine-protein kinase LECRK2 n=1 Tax=Phragmites australis TaxID=29695 RepID=UPI002D77A423|nr:G-type lectin S-receptor-like serine/threonine-protein kinase LECRK2 [Phragmites australis]
MPVALTSRNLTTGDTLMPPSYITSPSGDFAFGFRALDSDTSSFLLAIWFHFDGTVVWFATDAGSGSAVVAAGQSVLSLTAAGQLSLSDPDGNTALWNPIQIYGSLLVLRDNGNLQFIGAGGSPVVWESFQYPTDTLLPGQSMRPGTNLRSRRADMGFSLGHFSFNVQRDGNIVMYMTGLPGDSSPVNAYWNTGTSRAQDGNTTLFFDVEPAGHLYYILTDASKHNLTTPQFLHSTTSSFYQHARLEPDGIFRVYIIPKSTTIGNATWAIVDQLPTDGCKTITTGLHGMCGPNSYCIYRTNKQRIDCECPIGYVFVDPQFRYKGCIPAFPPDSCDGKNHSAEFKLMELPNTNWVNSVFYKRHTLTTEEQCRNLCLNSCFCAAALFDGKNCSEIGMLLTGWQTNDTTTRTLVKVRTRGPPLQILPYVVIAVLAMLFLATACILLGYCYITKKARKNLLSARVFTRKELCRATNGFDKLLGQGGFGKVYHGFVKSLQPPDVAVKQLSSIDEYREKEFENEVQSIGRIHHKNLVRMVGYCKEGVHRMLVFEFMPGGSLGEFLFKSERPSWSWRAEAAVAIARGLEYLHYGCTSQIIHCDIKPDNILLDSKYAPKITDFGIARLLGDNKVKQTITHVRGTLGYLAPEWFNNERQVDSKVDVFSFGIVLLEMICCKKHPDQDGPRRDDDHSDLGMAVTLRAWVADLIREDNIERIVQGDSDALQDLQRVERFARVAIWCVQVDPSTRPTMRNVVWMLEGAMDVDPLPDPPRTLDFSATTLSASSGSGSGTHDHSSSMTE